MDALQNNFNNAWQDVANLAPRSLRGITSEGMMLAADDGEGNVKLITIDGDISQGSQVR